MDLTRRAGLPYVGPHPSTGCVSTFIDEVSMNTIGFIGLGVMGAPMAENLVRAGFDVTGYTRRPSGTDRLVAAGGRRAADVAAAARGSDVVITMLPDSPDVAGVVLGTDGTD